MYKLTGLLLCFISCNLLASGSEPELAPARFVDADNAGVKTITLRDVSVANEVRIYCFSRVYRDGWLGRVSCKYQGVAEEGVFRKLLVELQRTRLQPARVDGRRKEIWFQYAGVIKKTVGETTEILVFPHVFLNVKEFGMNYSAPQSYNWIKNAGGCGDSHLVWVEVEIDEQGVASNPRIFNASSGYGDRCFENLKETIVKAKYIPAYKDGQPVKSRYIQPYFTWQGWGDWTRVAWYDDGDPLSIGW